MVVIHPRNPSASPVNRSRSISTRPGNQSPAARLVSSGTGRQLVNDGLGRLNPKTGEVSSVLGFRRSAQE